MDVVVMANTVHGYMSQSDKGEMVIGGGTDGFNNTPNAGLAPYPRTRCAGGNLPDAVPAEDAAAMGRIVTTGDRSPLISKTPWGTASSTAAGGRGLQGHSGVRLGDGRLMAKGDRGRWQRNSTCGASRKAVHRRVGGRRGCALMLRPDFRRNREGQF